MMKKKKNPRGLFERPPASGVWWINYYVKGKQHREKVGRKSDAIDLYQVRKADATVGRKLPNLCASKVVTVSELIDDALEFVVHHKDLRNYVSKAAIFRKAMGSVDAADVKPQALERWLRLHCKTAATSNRYKAFISLCFREGIRNGKVGTNPARLVGQRKESAGRLRFLSYDEYDTLHEVISKRFPEHLAEYIVSVHTGMRLSEQYTIQWSQVHLDRRTIELTKTKNGHARTVHLNADAVAAIESVKRPGQRGSDRLFPREGTKGRFDTRSGTSRASRTRKSPASYGIQIVILTVAGWRWLVRRSRRSRRLPGTRRSRWPPDTVTYPRPTSCQSSSASSEQALNRHRRM